MRCVPTTVYGNHEFSAKGNVGCCGIATTFPPTLIDRHPVDPRTVAVDFENCLSMIAAKPAYPLCDVARFSIAKDRAKPTKKTLCHTKPTEYSEAIA
jgi:hypothetical protein